MKTLIILFLLLMLIGCRRNAQSITPRGDFEVEFLFEHDGCKVYRFIDDGRPRYFSNCRGQISYRTGGKHPVEVITLNN